jgi:hypothetical protein
MRCDTVLNRIFVCSSCKVICIYCFFVPNKLHSINY